MARAAGHSDFLAGVLAGGGDVRAMAGEPERAMALASEGLTVARRLGAPSFLALNLVALAAASAEEDPDRANALLPRERCAPRPPRPRNLESLHAGRHRQRAYRRLAANCLRSRPRRSARCTGPATDRSSPPWSTTWSLRALDSTTDARDRRDAPRHRTPPSSPARPTTRNSSTKQAVAAPGTADRRRRGRFRHDTARRDHGSTSAISSATHACTSSECRVEPWMTTTPSPLALTAIDHALRQLPNHHEA